VVGTIVAIGLAKLGGQRSDSSHQPSASLASYFAGCSQRDSGISWVTPCEDQQDRKARGRDAALRVSGRALAAIPVAASRVAATQG
jgi:hypothetical protein